MLRATCRNSRLAIFSALAALAVLSPLTLSQRKAPGQAANVAVAKSIFHAKCAMCHGDDGAGSEVGKSMHAPDLRSPEVQKQPSSALAEVIANGKNGMPSFKDALNENQIHSLVTYVRSLAAKK